VAVCFFGEGALGQGVLYECFNLAQLWKLPVVYVCENNMYSEYTHFSETTAGDIPTRAAAFGIRAETVDGQDVRAVFAVATTLAFLVCNTYRYRGHHVGDINREYYRSKKEEQEWLRENDPIKNYSDWLKAEKHADATALSAIESELKAEMDSAMKFAISAPYPGIDEVDQDVYA
jgi:TPP-dependent pyruvate/acetoin dehydrogenase alpha subunit